MLNKLNTTEATQGISAHGRLHPAMRLWMTLAHRDTAPSHLSAQSTDVRELADALLERDQAPQAVLATKIARELVRSEVSRHMRPSRVDLGAERYVWAFGRLDDALTALHANHRSDYRTYAEPQTLHEASVDRLYRRFPLADYPHTTALLFAGIHMCDDPRLSADPEADTFVGAAPTAIARDQWDNYTVCGFHTGVSLVRVSAATRWLRVDLRAIEDAWATTLREASLSSVRTLDTPQVMELQANAHHLLLRGASPQAYITLEGGHNGGETATEPATVQPTTPLRAVRQRPGRRHAS